MELKYNDFTYQDLREKAIQHQEEYKKALPFPYIVFDNFFKPSILKEILKEFPQLSEKTDIHYKNPNESKFASNKELRFGEHTRDFLHYLNSQPFLEFLQDLTGIKETLVPDPYFEGGGLHQIKRGGYLKLHVDFHKHRKMNLDRRLNVLVYLNENWEEEYGGFFELWETDMSKCAEKIAPLFNRLVIFSTTGSSWHGHPDALTCPEDRSRKSMALYYYTNGRPKEEVANVNSDRITTTFANRKDQDSTKMTAYNSMVNLANDLLPPLFVRTIKKYRNK